MTGIYIATGPCFVCGLVFEFNPERVPALLVDPSTGVPPDVGGTDPAGSVRQPLCSGCVVTVNAAKRQLGRPEIRVLPGAYDGTEELS